MGRSSTQNHHYNMKKALTYILVACGILMLTTECYSQIRTRSSIGIGGGINLPLQDGYRIGRDRALQLDLRLKNKLSIVSSLGWETIKGAKKGVYNGYYFSESGRSVDLVFLNVSAKYYFNKTLFGFAGPSVYVGGDDAGSSGIGGNVGAGYDWAVDDYSSLELSLLGEVLPVYSKTVPVAGLRLAYKFNFNRRY
jgi:hypothetical protein